MLIIKKGEVSQANYYPELTLVHGEKKATKV